MNIKNKMNNDPQIINSRPKIYDEIIRNFPAVSWDNGIIITYDNKIYTKSGYISDDLMIHEQTHIKQQAEFPGGSDAWWNCYFKDMGFRLGQEIEAYKNQWKYLKSTVTDKNKLTKYRYQIATDLSSAIYGNMISPSAAMRVIM